jgi:crotonobetainyl-CoA:carnitine CoA-transferase CaiB-like acyl-CoA transferase
MRVLELPGGMPATYAGWLLASLGFEVLRLENAEERQADSGALLWLNHAKHSFAIDFGADRLPEQVEELVRGCSAILHDGTAGLPSWAERAIPVTVPRVGVSPFGATGPMTGWKTDELIVQAASGLMASTGHADSAPRMLPGQPAAFVTGLNAAITVLASVVAPHGAAGAKIDIAEQESASHLVARHTADYVYSGMETTRRPRGFMPQGFPETAAVKDGYIYLLALQVEWQLLAYVLGLQDFMTEEWASAETRRERWPEIQQHFERSLASRTRYEWFELGAKHGLTFAPADSPLQVTSSPQSDARGYWKTVRTDDGQVLSVPGLPFPWQASPASSAGEPHKLAPPSETC